MDADLHRPAALTVGGFARPQPWQAEAGPAASTGAASSGSGLRRHLFGLVLATLLPALAFGAVASWEALRRHGEAAEARLLSTASALAAAVDSHVAGHLAALTVLAASPDWQAPEGQAPDGRTAEVPAALAALAGRTGDAFGAWVVIFDAEGHTLLHTAPPAMPAQATPPRLSGRPWVARTLESGQPLVSDLVATRATNRQVALAMVPIRHGGAVRRVAAMPVLPDRLHLLLAGLAAGRDGAAAITDRTGIVLAHSSHPTRLVGQPRPPRPDGPPLGRTGVLQGRSLTDGAPIRTAYHAIASAPGWMVWVSEPEASFSAAQYRPLLALGGGGLLALALGLAFAAALSRRLLRPVEALVEHAEAVAGGATWQEAPPGALPPAKVREFERLRRAVVAAEAALREAEAKYRRVQRIGRVGGFMIDLALRQHRSLAGVHRPLWPLARPGRGEPRGLAAAPAPRGPRACRPRLPRSRGRWRATH